MNEYQSVPIHKDICFTHKITKLQKRMIDHQTCKFVSSISFYAIPEIEGEGLVRQLLYYTILFTKTNFPNEHIIFILPEQAVILINKRVVYIS